MFEKETILKENKNRWNSIKLGIYIFSFCMILAISNNKMAAVSATQPETAASETEAKQNTGSIVKENGKKYYEYSNGKRAKNKFIKVKSKTYYFGKKGAMEKGWIKKDGNYYYLDRKTGVQKKNCKIDGIKLKKDGKADKTKYNKSKIDTMIKTKSILNKITKPTDSKSQKLKKAFDWVLKHPYKRYRILAKAKKTKGWEVTYANDIYKNGKGCCVSESCAFAFLARECGYKNVYVCDDTMHAWVEIDGRIYDTLFAEAKSYNNYFNSTYKVAKLHCVNRLKF